MAKTFKIKINVDEVKYDVFNTTHRAGLAVESADESQYRTAAQMIASIDDNDILQIERSIANAGARIKTEFGEYLAEPIAGDRLDHTTQDPSQLLEQAQGVGSLLGGGSMLTPELEYDNVIPEDVRKSGGYMEYSFKMPSNFNANAVEALQGGIHDYIVASTIADWFTTTNPSLVKPYQETMVIALSNAKRALYKRSRPTRPEHYA